LTRHGAVSASDAAGFVLAGGRSSRMGSDKALLQFAGQSLVARALDILRASGLAPSIAGARSNLSQFAPVIEDSRPALGPLGGICAALASTSAQCAVFLPVDLPLIPAALLTFLLHHAQITGAAITVPSVNGYAQTFPAVVRRSALPALESALREGPGGCFSAFHAAAAQLGQPFSVLPVELLVQSGQIAHPDGFPAGFWFQNVNTPGELERAEFLLKGRRSVI